MLVKEYIFKVILVGDSGVGKTSLVLNFIENKFETQYIPTIGTNIYSNKYEIDGTTFNLMIWDVGGQECWERVRQQYFRGADGAFIVFDVTKPETFYSVENWYAELIKEAKKNPKIILLGNKSDLVEERKVTADQFREFASRLGFDSLETSAKTGDNVRKAFLRLLKHIWFSRRKQSQHTSALKNKKTEDIWRAEIGW